MSSEELSALYYPYPTPRNVDKLKKALLIFDHIYFVIPAEKEAYHNLGIERGGVSMLDHYTELHHPLHEGVENDIFRIIKPAETVEEFSEAMIQALKEDRLDQQFVSEGQNQSDWLIYPEKIPRGLDTLFYGHEFSQYYKGRKFKLPFMVGESIMISHAVYACIAKEMEGESISPITDEPIHYRLLMNRLDRGVKNLDSKTDSIIPQPNREIFDIAVLPATTLSIEQVMQKKHDHPDSVRIIKREVKKAAEISKTRPTDYASQRSAVIKEIRRAYEEMGLINLRQKIISQIIGLRGQIIGASGPNIRNANITSTDTMHSRKLLGDIPHLSIPTVSYQLA